jgi:pyrroloquinoline quinone biosynthesis protein D
MTPTPDTVQEASLPTHPKLSRLFRLQFEPVQDSWVLLYPEGMVQLNPSAAEILRRCDGKRPFNDIVAELEGLFNVQGIADQVAALVQEGQRRGWID